MPGEVSAQATPPTRPLFGLDHIPFAVKNLEIATHAYAEMGFAFKPGRFHENGIRNNHVKFPDGSGIELLSASQANDELTTHYLEEAEALADRVIVLAKGSIVAEGSVAGIRSIVARKKISCATSVSLEQVREWAGVQDVRRDRHRLQITVMNAESVVQRLLAEDASLTELEVTRAGLAEAFVELTQENAR